MSQREIMKAAAELESQLERRLVVAIPDGLPHDQHREHVASEIASFMEALDTYIDARISDALDREHGRGDYRS